MNIMRMIYQNGRCWNYNMPKKKSKSLKITYRVIGTSEENQEKLDRVFDIIFAEVERRQKLEKDNGTKNDFG